MTRVLSPGLQLASSFHTYDVAMGRRGATGILGSVESVFVYVHTQV